MPTTAEKSKTFQLRPRRAVYLTPEPVETPDREVLEAMDAAYRALCAIMFNFVPGSGHPGGSISSGRIVFSLLYKNLRYDFTRPDSIDNDLLVYAAGHKATGLYGMYALRDEWVRIARPDLLVADEPTGNLDPINTHEIVQILKKINDLGTTVILATHNRGVIDSVGSRVITMENGKVIRDTKNGK